MTEIFLTIVVGAGLLTCGFFLGKGYWTRQLITALVEDGYLRYRNVGEDEVELLKPEKPIAKKRKTK